MKIIGAAQHWHCWMCWVCLMRWMCFLCLLCSWTPRWPAGPCFPDVFLSDGVRARARARERKERFLDREASASHSRQILNRYSVLCDRGILAHSLTSGLNKTVHALTFGLNKRTRNSEARSRFFFFAATVFPRLDCEMWQRLFCNLREPEIISDLGVHQSAPFDHLSTTATVERYRKLRPKIWYHIIRPAQSAKSHYDSSWSETMAVEKKSDLSFAIFNEDLINNF